MNFVDIFVQGFPETTTAKQIQEFLGPTVRNFRVITHQDTNRSRRFGFAQVRAGDALNLIEEMNGKVFGGKIIRVDFSNKYPKHEVLKRAKRAKKSDNMVLRDVSDLDVGLWLKFGEKMLVENLVESNSKFHVEFVFKKAFVEIVIRKKMQIVSLPPNTPGSELLLSTLISLLASPLSTPSEIFYVVEIHFTNIFGLFYDCKKNKVVLSLRNPPKLFLKKVEDQVMSSRVFPERIVDFSKNKKMGEYLNYIFRITNRAEVSKLLEKCTHYGLIEEGWGYNKDIEFVTQKPFSLMEYFYSAFSKEVFYTIRCCWSHHLFNEYALTSELFDELRRHEQEYVQKFFDDLYWDRIHSEDLLKTFNEWKSNKQSYRKYNRDKFRKNENYSVVKRISVTPTHVYFEPEDFDIGNRVIRKFDQKHEKSFARVSFVDEDVEYRRIYYSPEIGKRIHGILLNGIEVGNYNFKFLATSNSQLRNVSLWMFADNEEISCGDIRKWMGDFSSIKNVAKYAARMGQTLSTTTPTSVLTEDEFVVTDDYKTMDGKYIFTDGCGIIDVDFARQISKKLKYKIVPSAFQFRFAGCKGVVATYDTKSFGGSKVLKLILRKSHVKFESDHFNFEVIRRANFRPCYLNRQIISLLSTRGIQDSVFLKYQREMVKNFEDMFKDREIAGKVLREYNVDNFVSEMLISLLKSEFSFKDNFIRLCLQSISRFKRLELKEKSKIFVRNGSLMIGVCDETRTLQYGQVFVQIKRSEQDEAQKIEGPVVVGKNPCFHPGDLRTLQAVDVPGLRHLYNVVVFPTLGERDIPNECSGSDLDGDIYFVSWEKDLIPESKNFDPMDYTPPPPKEQDRIDVSDICQFFVDSMKNDVLGKIANAHLAHYAFSPNGVQCEMCVELAELHSIAVDFPKTGVPAVYSSKHKPPKYPLFMEKPRDKYHSEESPCVVEKLYLDVTTLDKNEVKDHQHFFFDQDLHMPEESKKYITETEGVFHEYSYDIKRILRQHRIRSESDLFSYLFIKYVKHVRDKRMTQIKTNLDELIKKYQRIFEEGTDTVQEKMEKASAWYAYAYLFQKQKKKIYSFAFINYQYLILLKKSKMFQ